MDGYRPPTALPFRRGSMSWRINMEPVIGLGGGRALLLQVLHPLVAAGVEQYSNFEREPFRRGFRTADIMLKLAFGEPEVSARQARLLRRMHERVKGVSPEGVAYDAMDPSLLVWVWATLVDVSLLMYQRGVAPLSALERSRYYEEQKLVAYASGVPEGGCPVTYGDFAAYVRRTIDTDLRATRVARIVAFAGRHPPAPWPLGPLSGIVGSFFTAGLLPERFRDELGYAWSPRHDRVLATAFAALRVGRVVPRPLRHLPNRYLVRRKTPLGWWRSRQLRIPAELSEA